jgi:(p)ppGpp synthase/HD superfamily hydrolase
MPLGTRYAKSRAGGFPKPHDDCGRSGENTVREAYAQTNLQLYSQLRRLGATEQDLAMVRAGYDLAMHLSPASFRGSGKPLLAHLVGTASILASIRQSPKVVTAGLLHAAYVFGDFGDGISGITTSRRERVRQAVGPDVEELVARYTRFDWNKNTIPKIRERVQTLIPIEREVLVIRLANELEDHLDFGVLYCGNGEKRRDYIRSPLNQSVEMANMLGLTELAAELDAAFTDTLTATLPETLRNTHDYTFVQPPASHSPRFKIAVGRFLDARPRLAKAVHPFASFVGIRG